MYLIAILVVSDIAITPHTTGVGLSGDLQNRSGQPDIQISQTRE
jgi:hypothetical protein